MRQRGFGLITFLPYIIGGLAIASLAGWVWWQANSWCNRACGEATERADIAESQLVAAHERATYLSLKWAEAIHKVEVKYVEVVKWRTQTFVEIRERPYHAEGSITLGPDARGVLRDSASAANGAGSATGDSQATTTVPAATGDGGQTSEHSTPAITSAPEWVDFSIRAAEAYAEAREKWLACVAWADSIKRAGAATAASE
jgi:hypothetical protein